MLVAMTTTLPELSISMLTALGVKDIGVAIGNAFRLKRCEHMPNPRHGFSNNVVEKFRNLFGS